MCHSSGGGGSGSGGGHVGKKSWQRISEVDASLALELHGDKNIFVPVEVAVGVGGASCVRMEGGWEMCNRRLPAPGPLALWRGCEQHFEEGVGATARC